MAGFGKGLAAAAGVALALSSASGLAAEKKADARSEETRAIMRQIFESVQYLLPLSVDLDAFRSEANAAAVREAFSKIARGAATLAAHERDTQDAEIGFLGRSLARSAREALSTYERGRYESAEFLLHRMTEYCVTCHSRLPSKGDSPLSENFLEGSDLAVLPLEERASLQIATRRFDEALVSFEALFKEPSVHPALMLGPLTDYLTISIRVKGDFARPIPVLEKLLARADLWQYLAIDVESWLKSLRQFQAHPPGPPSLEAARQLIDAAKHSIRFPADRQAVVEYIMASKLLRQYLSAHPGPGRDAAEAYYLLGLTESRIGRNYWVSEADFLLEEAIRMAPGEPFARDAYALLEEETVLGYTGSAGVHIPADVAKRLADLLDQIEKAQKK